MESKKNQDDLLAHQLRQMADGQEVSVEALIRAAHRIEQLNAFHEQIINASGGIFQGLIRLLPESDRDEGMSFADQRHLHTTIRRAYDLALAGGFDPDQRPEAKG